MNRKNTYRLSFFICLVCVVTAACMGCGKEKTAFEDQAGLSTDPIGSLEFDTKQSTTGTQTVASSAAAPGEFSFQGRVLDTEEAALLEKLQDAAGETILLFDCADYDGDGRREAFAFTGTDRGEYLEGVRWYVSLNEVIALSPERKEDQAHDSADVRNEHLQKHSSVIQTEDGTCFWYAELDGTSSSLSLLWGVANGDAYETVLSGKGMQLMQDKNESFVLTQSSFDANRDGTGHTYKPCYFYYENGKFHEYGAVNISREDFLLLNGANACVSSLMDNHYWIQNVLLRGNGLIQVNLSDGNTYRNVTCRLEGGRMSVVSENDGITGLLIGNIASDDWSGNSPELEKLWNTEHSRGTGMLVPILPYNVTWYDLDGDAVPESIQYVTGIANDNQTQSNIQLLINGQKVWSALPDDFTDYTIWITDLHTGDGKKEVLIEGLESSDCLSMFTFFSFNENALHELGDLLTVPILNETGDLYRIRLWDVDREQVLLIPGDATVTVWADTPVYINSFGCYYIKMSYRLDANGMTQIVQDEYEIQVPGMNDTDYLYTAQTSMLFYASPQQQLAGVPSFTVPEGGQLKALAIAPFTQDSLYVKMQCLDTQEEGWILISEWPVFVEIQAWG